MVYRSVRAARGVIVFLGVSALPSCGGGAGPSTSSSATAAASPVGAAATTAQASTTPAPSVAPSASETAAAATSSTVAADPAAARGPVVSIPAGLLLAGNRCGAVPRITPEELPGEKVDLAAFDVDVYPYPNDAGRPARLGVTRDEAQALCQERGARLCTELEWERACKGPDNAAYAAGGSPKDRCKGEPNLITGKRPDCKSPFGMIDPQGLAFEWTSSNWGRGTSGGGATVRGMSNGKATALELRCAYGQSRNPQQAQLDVGFRCCSGPENPAAVHLEPLRRDPLVDGPAPDGALKQALLAAMPVAHRTVAGYDVDFDRMWYWHPVANEELVVARWVGSQRRSRFFEVAVFTLCGSYAVLSARMRGPVAELVRPAIGVTPTTLSFDVRTRGDRGTVRLAYSHGWVSLLQPDWVKEGNHLESDAPAPATTPGRRPTPARR